MNPETLEFEFDLTLQLPQVFDICHLLFFAVSIFLFILLVIQSKTQSKLEKGSVNTASSGESKNEEQLSASEVHDVPKAEDNSKKERREPAKLLDMEPSSALQLLSSLQREARILDFIQEDVTQFSDEEVGAAARVVHSGTKKAIESHFTLEPIRDEEEGERITLPKGFDNRSVRVTGKVAGEPPFSGTLVHRGWRAADIRLPKVSDSKNIKVLASAEVEI